MRDLTFGSRERLLVIQYPGPGVHPRCPRMSSQHEHCMEAALAIKGGLAALHSMTTHPWSERKQICTMHALACTHQDTERSPHCMKVLASWPHMYVMA